MLNKVILIGNVGSDPDIRMFPNGGRVANFSLATSEYWTDKTGQYTSQQDGAERTAVEIALQGFDHTIKLLDPRPNTDAHNQNGNNEPKQPSYNEEEADIDNNSDENVVDDDIPF